MTNKYATGNKKPLGIYIHIPFCIKKCAYCDFLSFDADKLKGLVCQNNTGDFENESLDNSICMTDFDIKDKYLSALEKDINETVTSIYENEYEIDTVFIGGGTPSSLCEEHLEKLCVIIKNMLVKMGSKNNNVEITMECNPGTLNEAKVKILKNYGINRISLGLQSANDEELRLLGRIHNYDDFLQSYGLLRKEGFDNVNIDLMSALPGQTVETYVNTLNLICQLSPEHISAYSLIIEEGTLFYEKYASDDKLRYEGNKPLYLPSEEEERLMYEKTEEILEQYGYNRYEISNYSKKGCESQHNTRYWRGKAYIGVGLGAASYVPVITDNEGIAAKRYIKTKNMKGYLQNDFGEYDIENLTKSMLMEEFMFLGLRMMEGISKNNFKNNFGVSLEQIYKEKLDKFYQEGLLENDGDKVCLTKKGISVSNYVFEGFLL